MYVYFYSSRERFCRGGVRIGAAKAAGVEVLGGVFVGDEEEGEGIGGGGRVCGVNGGGRGGVVFASVEGEGFEEGGAVKGRMGC